MAFITRKDLTQAIREYEIDQITDSDPALVDIAINTAIGEMRPYLFRYDTERIFSAENEQREPLLVRFAVDIAVFELCSIARPDQDLENRRALYNRAIGWLKEVRDENMPTGLPLRPNDPEAPVASEIAAGGTPARSNYY